MESFRPLSTSDQLTEHLRREIESGKMTGTFPGIRQLVQALGVNSVAVSKAVKQLEHEGLLVNQGDRRSRLVAKIERIKGAVLKVGILYYDASNTSRFDALQMERDLSHAGHAVIRARKSLLEMGMDVRRTARLVHSMDVDAWVVFAGSREILRWFEDEQIPAFALYGRLNQVNLASMGIRKMPVMSELVSKLVGYGHRRIVMLARQERRKPQLGMLEQFLIDELEANGIHTGSYNIPDWVDSPDGLQQVIQTLFQYTPPTALILGDSLLFHATQMHLAHRGILAPKQVSLFCNDSELSFSWVRPEVSHARWDYRPAIRRIVQWASNVARGKADTKKSHINAVLHEGGTIGPVPRGG